MEHSIIPYEFNDNDIDITEAQSELYVSLYVLCRSKVNYGGRIVKVMHTSDIIVADSFNERILELDYAFSETGLYSRLIAPDVDASHSSGMKSNRKIWILRLAEFQKEGDGIYVSRTIRSRELHKSCSTILI